MKQPWPPAGVLQRQSEHSSLERLIQACEFDDDLLNKSLARYLVVRSTGLIEAVRDDVADGHCRVIGHPRAHRRITAHLRTGLGVKPEQLLAFVGSFESGWQTNLEAFLNQDDSRRRGLLGAMVAARKKIAHGDGESVTVRRALDWSGNAREIADWLVHTFNPK